ncbi:hypothetical protein BKA69DRAFT_1127772 [Paraphysoderma sedebokerense]|nr:hypothetical protein BKA69DRAFT_1127772 [Paraphysoderma sedebokerense]
MPSPHSLSTHPSSSSSTTNSTTSSTANNNPFLNLLHQQHLHQQLANPDCDCFNCLLPRYSCLNFGSCNNFTGLCDCPPGFGGPDCSKPVCGALPDGVNRPIREGPSCQCKEGWAGINCNVCTQDSVCDSMVPTGQNGTCYKNPVAVSENFEICKVTNPKINSMLELLGPNNTPEVTFNCNRTEASCSFQFWVGGVESFYCGLSGCNIKELSNPDPSIPTYQCQSVSCRCVPGELLCGKENSIDITEFLEQEIRGPGTFNCKYDSNCKFREPGMNDLINQVFGDDFISLDCKSGECLHISQVPGFTRPPPPSGAPAVIIISVSVLTLMLVTFGAVYAFARRKRSQLYNQLNADDEMDKLMDDHVPASLMFRDITYQIGNKEILYGIQGAVKPGEVMAIMGASGAGKSTFLDILARRNKTGTVSGEIYVNGKALADNEFKRIIGFVDQEDTLMGTLTVEETIMYSALLRLPRDMSFEAKRTRVRDTMMELGILRIANSRIGSPGSRGISGGEKRRVSIACELVTSPSIIFLDEPTSGLDSYNAYNVVECLVNLARNYNRTVVFTIHQPRSNIYALFDHLVLLSRGKMVYSGPAQTAVDHFAKLGFECPVGFNIADYLIDLTMYAERADVGDFDNDDDHDHDLDSSRPHQEESSSSESSPLVSTPVTTDPSPMGSQFPSPSQKTPRSPLNPTSIKSLQEQRLFTRKMRASIVSNHSLIATQTRRKRNSQSLGGGVDTERKIYFPSGSGSGSASGSGGKHTKNLSLDIPFSGNNTNQSGSVEAINAASTPHLQMLVDEYCHSETYKTLDAEIKRYCGEWDRFSSSALSNPSESSTVYGFKRASWFTQFRILSDRAFKNLYRNPYLLLMHYSLSICVALLCGFLYWRVSNDIAGFQNRMGCFFFICALFGFSCLTSLHVFAAERILFMRERANHYYAPFTYFLSKVIFDVIPLRVVPPFLMGVIIYHMVGLVPVTTIFLKFLLVLVMFNLTAASICLFTGIVIEDLSVANLLSILVMLFSMLFGGLLLNKDRIPEYLRWLKHLSFFNYALEALVVNELKDLQLAETKYGLVIDVPAAVILSTFGFNAQSYWTDVVKLSVMFTVFLVASFVCLQVFVRERR